MCRFPTNSILLDDPIMKASEYRMVDHLIHDPGSDVAILLRATKLQKCTFKRINWILTSSDGLTKFDTIEVSISRYIAW